MKYSLLLFSVNSVLDQKLYLLSQLNCNERSRAQKLLPLYLYTTYSNSYISRHWQPVHRPSIFSLGVDHLTFDGGGLGYLVWVRTFFLKISGERILITLSKRSMQHKNVSALYAMIDICFECRILFPPKSVCTIFFF